MLLVHQGGLWSPWSTWSTPLQSDPDFLKFYRKCRTGWISLDQEGQGNNNPPWWTRIGFYILLMLRPGASCLPYALDTPGAYNVNPSS